ncbi:YceI family protein [Caulobacter sp. 17J65-9]|uniref:YceI family protein n=1 Tax=Caulobacter sp. 17J65-9 TaxID=2709382 RepID=UPI0013C6CBD7|nr:YceI family protein [Caulobacter sp. 17J65-9]NEX93197.1 polyisoprenoid-binding protein [Caulobacter sp. 17J65-9]
MPAARPLLLAAAVLALGACHRTPEPVKTDVPAGTYKLDPAHASLVFRVNHLGMSHYTARFTRLDATLELAPKSPAASRVNATVDPRSLETDYPLPEPDFDAQLTGPDWLDAARYPAISFRTTKVEPTGPDTAEVTGDLTLHGVTRPVTLNARYNGGYASHAMDPSGARIGFSATGSLNRSDFGISAGIPAKGSTFGVSDEVQMQIEAEFTRPKG